MEEESYVEGTVVSDNQVGHELESCIVDNVVESHGESVELSSGTVTDDHQTSVDQTLEDINSTILPLQNIPAEADSEQRIVSQFEQGEGTTVETLGDSASHIIVQGDDGTDTIYVMDNGQHIDGGQIIEASGCQTEEGTVPQTFNEESVHDGQGVVIINAEGGIEGQVIEQDCSGLVNEEYIQEDGEGQVVLMQEGETVVQGENGEVYFEETEVEDICVEETVLCDEEEATTEGGDVVVIENGVVQTQNATQELIVGPLTAPGQSGSATTEDTSGLSDVGCMIASTCEAESRTSSSQIESQLATATILPSSSSLGAGLMKPVSNGVITQNPSLNSSQASFPPFIKVSATTNGHPQAIVMARGRGRPPKNPANYFGLKRSSVAELLASEPDDEETDSAGNKKMRHETEMSVAMDLAKLSQGHFTHTPGVTSSSTSSSVPSNGIGGGGLIRSSVSGVIGGVGGGGGGVIGGGSMMSSHSSSLSSHSLTAKDITSVPYHSSTYGMMSSSSSSQSSAIGSHYAKPRLSYAQLIAESLLESPDRMLPLNEIYLYISQKYPYYKMALKGWQNAIRHNLTLNSSFRKVPRPNAEGRGNLWLIEDGAERTIYKRTIRNTHRTPTAPSSATSHLITTAASSVVASNLLAASSNASFTNGGNIRYLTVSPQQQQQRFVHQNQSATSILTNNNATSSNASTTTNSIPLSIQQQMIGSELMTTTLPSTSKSDSNSLHHHPIHHSPSVSASSSFVIDVKQEPGSCSTEGGGGVTQHHHLDLIPSSSSSNNVLSHALMSNVHPQPQTPQNNLLVNSIQAIKIERGIVPHSGQKVVFISLPPNSNILNNSVGGGGGSGGQQSQSATGVGGSLVQSS